MARGATGHSNRRSGATVDVGVWVRDGVQEEERRRQVGVAEQVLRPSNSRGSSVLIDRPFLASNPLISTRKASHRSLQRRLYLDRTQQTSRSVPRTSAGNTEDLRSQYCPRFDPLCIGPMLLPSYGLLNVLHCYLGLTMRTLGIQINKRTIKMSFKGKLDPGFPVVLRGRLPRERPGGSV